MVLPKHAGREAWSKYVTTPPLALSAPSSLNIVQPSSNASADQPPAPKEEGLWEPFLRTSADGSTIQLYYSKETPTNDQSIVQRTSTDSGQSWSAEKIVIGVVSKRDGMPSVATVPGGDKNHLIAVYESNRGNHYTVNAVTSPDDGASWSTKEIAVYAPVGRSNNAGSPFVVGVGGTLVVSFMTDEDTGEHDWPAGASAKVVTSNDGGRTWGGKTTVAGPETKWPGMVRMDGGSALVLFDDGAPRVRRVGLKGC